MLLLINLHIPKIYNFFILFINFRDASTAETVAPAKVPTQLNLHHTAGSHLSRTSSKTDFVPRVPTPVEESLINSIRKTSVTTPTNEYADLKFLIRIVSFF